MVYYLILFPGFLMPLYSIITEKEISEAKGDHIQKNAAVKQLQRTAQQPGV